MSPYISAEGGTFKLGRFPAISGRTVLDDEQGRRGPRVVEPGAYRDFFLVPPQFWGRVGLTPQEGQSIPPRKVRPERPSALRAVLLTKFPKDGWRTPWCWRNKGMMKEPRNVSVNIHCLTLLRHRFKRSSFIFSVRIALPPCEGGPWPAVEVRGAIIALRVEELLVYRALNTWGARHELRVMVDAGSRSNRANPSGKITFGRYPVLVLSPSPITSTHRKNKIIYKKCDFHDSNVLKN
ncbi:unnamed protein product, partial [Nesidiocoris tenuis]